MTSPKVIFNCKFTYAINSPDNKNINKERAIKKINGMFDYYSDDKKRAMNMFDYYTGNLNKSENMNLVLENGKYATSDEIAKRKKQYARYLENSHLWQGVISFNNDYINENITIDNLEQKMIKKVIPEFFKKCGFSDINKMSYQIALHTDTDNLHFHFSFIEKRPNTLSKDGLVYRRSGKLTKAEIDFMKNSIVHTIEREKIYTPLLKETNKEIDELKKYFNPKEKNFILRDKNDLKLENDILELGKLLYEDRSGKETRIKFNSITDKEITNLTKNIKNSIFTEKLSDQYTSFKNSLNKINDYFNEINNDNNIKTLSKNKLVETKLKYVDNYVLNAIVNHANYVYDKKKNSTIKDTDIIKNMALNIYTKNKKKNRYGILKNYLSGNSFKNKAKMEQAIKNINNELEEAKNKFSKLFENDSYIK